MRHFPDKLPIGVDGDERSHVFLYLVTRDVPVDFRAFLHRHAELFRALAEWELRLLVPKHLDDSGLVFDTAAREELGMPLRLKDVEELGWYFRQRQKVERGAVEEEAARYRRACRQFNSYRFRALYRQWKKGGDAFVHATVSRVLNDALTRRSGRVETSVLSAGVPATWFPGRLSVMGGFLVRRRGQRGVEGLSPRASQDCWRCPRQARGSRMTHSSEPAGMQQLGRSMRRAAFLAARGDRTTAGRWKGASGA